MNEYTIQKFSDYELIDKENVKLLKLLKEVMASKNYEEANGGSLDV